MIEAELIDDEDALQALADPWWELWRGCPSAHPFQSPAWLLPWWQAFRPGRLATVALREGGRLGALAPLYVEDGPLGRRLLPIGIGITDYLDVLATDETGPALVRAVGELVSGWDSWELEELSPGASGLALPCPSGCREAKAEQSAAPVLFLAAEGGGEPGGIPSRKRRKLRMSEHRIARREGAVRQAGADDVAAFLEDVIRLHGARWTERGEGGVLASPDVRRFHELALPELVAAGLARLSVLEMEGQAVGAYYGLHHRDQAYAYLAGFDPSFAFESPGTCLLGRAIAAAGQEGARKFHFLRGQEPYKYEWGAVDRWTTRRTFTRQAHG